MDRAQFPARGIREMRQIATGVCRQRREGRKVAETGKTAVRAPEPIKKAGTAVAWVVPGSLAKRAFQRVSFPGFFALHPPCLYPLQRISRDANRESKSLRPFAPMACMPCRSGVPGFIAKTSKGVPLACQARVPCQPLGLQCWFAAKPGKTGRDYRLTRLFFPASARYDRYSNRLFGA